jgi:hypothetical protein
MENPYLQSHMAVAAGLSGTARHSPNRAALATRKVCQNHEIRERAGLGLGLGLGVGLGLGFTNLNRVGRALVTPMADARPAGCETI